MDIKELGEIVFSWIKNYDWIRGNILPPVLLLLISFIYQISFRSKRSIFSTLSESEKSISDLDLVKLKKVFEDRAPIYGTLTGFSVAIIILLFSARTQFRFRSDFFFGEILFFLFTSFLSFFIALTICHTAGIPYFRDRSANERLLKRSSKFYLLGIFSLGISMMLCLFSFSEILFYVCLGVIVVFARYHIRR